MKGQRPNNGYINEQHDPRQQSMSETSSALNANNGLEGYNQQQNENQDFEKSK